LKLPQTLDNESFRRNMKTILVEVNAILAVKGKSRRRFRVLEIYEEGSDELVAEVLRTTLGMVIVYRNHVGRTPDGDFVLYRQGSTPHIAPLTGSPDQPVNIVSRARQYVIMGNEILQAITGGRDRLVLDEQHPGRRRVADR
jgi:hypothetical protein